MIPFQLSLCRVDSVGHGMTFSQKRVEQPSKSGRVTVRDLVVQTNRNCRLTHKKHDECKTCDVNYLIRYFFIQYNTMTKVVNMHGYKSALNKQSKNM